MKSNNTLLTNMSTFSIDPDLLAFAAGGAAGAAWQDGVAAKSVMHPALPADLYHGDREALSCSMIKPLLLSPAHFQSSLLRGFSATKAMDFGSLVHALVLQPHLVGQEFAIYPGLADGRAKEYKDFLAKNTERLVVDEPTFTQGRELAQKILERKVFGRYFGDFVREGTPEATIYFEEPTTGLRLKVRLDLYHPEKSFDLKTTRHSTLSAFVRDAVDMDYDLQAFMYTLGRSLYEGSDTAKAFVFVAAETDAPHSINVVTAGGNFMNNGAMKFQEALSVYAACTAAGYWPDCSSDGTAELEHWQAFSPKTDWRGMLAAS